jgi:streptomycin 6-kinase
MCDCLHVEALLLEQCRKVVDMQAVMSVGPYDDKVEVLQALVARAASPGPDPAPAPRPCP